MTTQYRNGCNNFPVVFFFFFWVLVEINCAHTHIHPEVGNVMRNGLNIETLSITQGSALGWACLLSCLLCCTTQRQKRPSPIWSWFSLVYCRVVPIQIAELDVCLHKLFWKASPRVFLGGLWWGSSRANHGGIILAELTVRFALL